MMTDQTQNYRMWQSPEGILIQAETGSIELSIADAIALAADITARLTLRLSPKVHGQRGAWSPALSAECVRLYVDYKLGTRRTGNLLGISQATARSWLIRAGVQIRPDKYNNLPLARAAQAAKHAARTKRNA